MAIRTSIKYPIALDELPSRTLPSRGSASLWLRVREDSSKNF